MSRTTIIDVAALAGVSKKTVSRVINHSPLINAQTRARVQAVIDELGFVPDPQARALALRRNFTVVLVHADPLDPMLPAIVAGMLDALEGSGHVLCLHRVDPAARALVRSFGDFLEYHRPGAVLLAPPLSAIDDLAGMCWEFGCGCARLGALGSFGGEGVVSADRAAMAELVGRMVARGHQRIGLVAGAEGDPTAQARELGYLDAMAEHGLDRGAALIAAGDGSFASGIEAGDLLLEVSPAPTAIVAANDEMAAGVLHAARARGMAAPDALALAGFGDSPLARRLCPPLTSVAVPLVDMAREAVARMLAPDSAAAQPLEAFACEVVERESTLGG